MLDDVAAPALFGIGRSLQLEGSRHAGIDNQLNIFLDNQLKGRRMDLLATTTSTCNHFFLLPNHEPGRRAHAGPPIMTTGQFFRFLLCLVRMLQNHLPSRCVGFLFAWNLNGSGCEHLAVQPMPRIGVAFATQAFCFRSRCMESWQHCKFGQIDLVAEIVAG